MAYQVEIYSIFPLLSRPKYIACHQKLSIPPRHNHFLGLKAFTGLSWMQASFPRPCWCLAQRHQQVYENCAISHLHGIKNPSAYLNADKRKHWNMYTPQRNDTIPLSPGYHGCRQASAKLPYPSIAERTTNCVATPDASCPQNLPPIPLSTVTFLLLITLIFVGLYILENHVALNSVHDHLKPAISNENDQT